MINLNWFKYLSKLNRPSLFSSYYFYNEPSLVSIWKSLKPISPFLVPLTENAQGTTYSNQLPTSVKSTETVQSPSPSTTTSVTIQSPTPTTTYNNSTNLMDLIKQNFPENEWLNAYNVMIGESGGRPDAVGDNYPINGLVTPSYGLYQIRGLPGRPSPEQLFDPAFNVKYAAQLWREQGWKPWTVAKNLGLY